jgi:hypothetical protein
MIPCLDKKSKIPIISDEEKNIETISITERLVASVTQGKNWSFIISLLKQRLHSIKHTALVLVLFLCSLYIMCLGNSIADRLNLNNGRFTEDTRLVLPDPIMSLMSHLSETMNLPPQLNHAFEVTAIALSCIYIILFPKSSRLDAFRRFFLVWACMNSLRTLCILLTVLTNPSLECQSKPISNLFLDAFAIFTVQRETCGDVFFSGHSVGYTLSCLMWLTYRRRRFSGTYGRILTTCHNLLTTCYILFIMICLITLIITRFHYSIEVFVGTFLTIIIWQKIHWLLEINELRQTPMGKFISKIDGTIYQSPNFNE